MRINTDFKDYYDGVLYNITEPNNKIWNRITKSKNINLPKWYVNKNQNKLLALIGNNNRLKSKNIWYVFKVVIICGEVYPYIIKTDINENITTYIFDEIEIANILNTNKYIAKYYETDLTIIKNGICNLFDSFKDELMKVDELPVIVTLEQYINGVFSRPEIIYSINNCLKDINFSKCLDSYTIAQNIDIYVNEQLTTENIPDNLSDLDKIRSYGFDEKYGFRKRK